MDSLDGTAYLGKANLNFEAKFYFAFFFEACGFTNRDAPGHPLHNELVVFGVLAPTGGPSKGPAYLESLTVYQREKVYETSYDTEEPSLLFSPAPLYQKQQGAKTGRDGIFGKGVALRDVNERT
jgi:hypothetical protein